MIAARTLRAFACGTLLLSCTPVFAQIRSTNPSTETQQNRVGTILRSLFGDQLGVSTSVEQQWALGRKPLATQRTQFHSRIDNDTRSGALTAANGSRMRAEYDRLVALETQYGADGRFTSQERTELADGYGALTQALTDGGYADGASSTALSVAEGRTEFERRVDASVSARRLSRTEGARLKRDYADLIKTEMSYATDTLSSGEREDLDSRLDALDARVGDTAYSTTPAVLDNRTRLSGIDRALNANVLSAALKTQLRVELGDLTRLDAAYARAAPTSDDKIYLERRIADLETRARVKR